MDSSTENNQLKLQLTVRQGVMVLPRCLQVLSRRGYQLTVLQTRQGDDGDAVLYMTIEGNIRWHKDIAALLERVIDVRFVRTEDRHE